MKGKISMFFNQPGILRGDLLCDGRQGRGHRRINVLERKDFPGNIDEGDVHAGRKEVLLEAVGLADAAFQEVALDGALETALGDGNEDAGHGIAVIPHKELITQAAGDAPLPMLHEPCNGRLAAEPLGFGEGGRHGGFYF